MKRMKNAHDLTSTVIRDLHCPRMSATVRDATAECATLPPTARSLICGMRDALMPWCKRRGMLNLS
jgi:hypothetical protein